MKDITQYFVDAAKPNDTSEADSVEEISLDESERLSGRKRNRVKIKISRRSTDERVCRIIDNNNDMVDKTPSPFPKLKEAGRLPNDDTPKKAILGKVPRITRKKISKGDTSDEPVVLAEVNLNHDSSPSKTFVVGASGRKKNDSHAVTTKNVKGDSNQAGSLGNKKTNKHTKSLIASPNQHETQSKKEDTITNEKPDTPVIDLTDDHKNNEDRQTEDAFQILMNKSKSSKSVSPTQTLSQDAEVHSRKSDEQKDKLKRSKEKLTALADRKGYSKRKAAEIEEGEVIEKHIQNRIKLLTGENKKDQESIPSVVQVNQKQPTSNLLNYFSKTSEAPIKNAEHISTFVVKADVHVSEDSDITSLKKSINRSKAQHDKRSKKPSTDLHEVDSIQVIESEEALCKSQPQQKKVDHQNKHRWSLRIKLQETDNVIDYMEGNSSDEEIFSRPRKLKEKKSESDPDLKNINRQHTKQLNGSTKPNLKKKKHPSNSEEGTLQSENLPKSTNCSSISMLHSTESQSSNNEFSNENISEDINKNSKENCTFESPNNSKRKPAEKLAPLFTKRRKPDPEILERKRLFFQSDISETENKTIVRKPATTALSFPRISHITQHNDTNCDTLEAFRIPMKLEELYTPILNTNNHKYIINSSEEKVLQSTAKKLSKPSIQAAIAEIEKQCAGAIKMWDRVSIVVKGHSSKKSPKTRNKKGKSIDNIESTTKFQSTEIQENSTWLYKYRPKTTYEVVGNEEAAGKLRDWLDGWRATLKDNDGNSSDEFYSSDCSYSSSNENNLVAVLLGPYGSGKSASVYAVAEELGYTVLEVNASSRRTGKKLLKEFEEATKSHRIRKENDIPLFKALANNLGAKKVPQNSLILLEDVDIIFEEDEGFISAAFQLASNTKRPIVMTCRNACPHLSKMAPQQNRIYFQNPTGSRVATLFELISLAETGYKLSQDCLAELLQPGDLRRALLQLQYLLLSGPPEASHQRASIRKTLWCDLRYNIYKPAIKMNKPRKGKKNAEVVTTSNSISDTLNVISEQLDTIALISTLVNIDDSSVTISHVNLQPSLSLIEDHSPYSASHSVSWDIAEWIERKTISNDQLSNQDGTQYRKNITLKKQLNTGVDLALSRVTSFVLDRQITSLDYLPCTRTICRAEDSRFSTNGKRANRFFHYLHGIKDSSTSLRPNILAAACKALQEKSGEEAS